ncbi:MAG: urease accessory protein UreF [Terriglobia bacterium]
MQLPVTLLQFADGLFPAGAYAHSLGFESYVQAGAVRDANQVEALLRTYLEGSAAPIDAVAALCAAASARAGDLDSCLALDEMLDAIKVAEELRAASRQMGRQTLRIAAHLTRDCLLTALDEAVKSDFTPGHHAVVFGMLGGILGWPGRETACALLYAASAALVGASLRLLPQGQLAGQTILWNVGPLIERLAEESQHGRPEQLWNFTPALEAAAMRHATIDGRLFRS